METRNATFDYIKAVAVVMVILHHCMDTYTTITSNYSLVFSIGIVFLHTCHVPVFLIVSGYFCHEQPIKQFYMKKITRIFIPFMFFSLLKLFYSFFISNEFSHGGDSYASQALYSFFIGRQYWFIYTILGCFLVAPLFWTRKNGEKSNAYIALLISYIIVCVIWVSKIILPEYFQFDHIVNYLPYFIFGCFLKQNLDLVRAFLNKTRVKLYVVSNLLIVLYLITYIYYPKVRNYPIRFWIAILFFYCIQETVKHLKTNSKMFVSVSKYSLQIMFLDGFYRTILFLIAQRLGLISYGSVFITQSSHKQLSLKHLLDKDFKSYLPLIMQQLTFSPAYDSLWIQ